MAEPVDTPRLIGDLLREGVVVARTGALCRVAIGDLESGDIPWLAGRAGAVTIWSPPSIGEQVLVLSPEGDLARGVVLPGMYSDAHPAPADDDSTRIVFGDGVWMGYDPGSGDGSGTAILSFADGTEFSVTPGKVTIRADVEITGKLTASGDVTGAGKSLKDHVHTKVQAGAAISGPPQ